MGIQDGAQLLEIMRGYQVSCILAAAVDLDLFEKLVPGARSAAEVAAAASCDVRATTIVLDALAAVGVIAKQNERYSLTAALAPFLTEGSAQSVLAMLRHQANCLRAGRGCRGPCAAECRMCPGPVFAAKPLTKPRSSRRCTSSRATLPIS